MLQLIDHDENQESYILVTQFMPGCSLLNYICQHGVFPLDETRVRKIILEIAQGLQDLHQMNIVHRDIKLANILMSGKNSGA